MSFSTSTLVNFATVIVIIYFINDWMCTFHSELLQVSVDCLHAHHEFVSDATRFPAISTMAESSHGQISFPSLPEEIQKWPKWLAQIGQKTLGHTIPVRNADGHHERVSLYALFVFGRYWNLDENIWPAADADFGQLTADAILAHCPGMPVPVQQQLRLEADQFHFQHRQTHLQMQVTLRQAIMQSIQGHSILVIMNPLNSDIDDTDLYQGSRILKLLLDQFALSIDLHRVDLGGKAARLAYDLKAKSDLTTADRLKVVSRLEEFIQTLRLAGLGVDRMEDEYVRNFINVLKSDTRHQMSRAVRAASAGIDNLPPNTIASLRRAFVEHLPHFDEPSGSAAGPAAGIYATAVSALTTTMQAAAFMTKAAARPSPSSDRTIDNLKRQVLKLKAENDALKNGPPMEDRGGGAGRGGFRSGFGHGGSASSAPPRGGPADQALNGNRGSAGPPRGGLLRRKLLRWKRRQMPAALMTMQQFISPVWRPRLQLMIYSRLQSLIGK